MPVLTSPPVLVDGTGEPVNGRVAIMPTSVYSWGGETVTTRLSAGVIRDGQFFDNDGESPFVLLPTPEGVAIRVVVYLEEVTGSGSKEHGISRVVAVPDAASVAWVDLVDVEPPAAGYVVPPWASVVLMAVEEVEAAAASAAASAAAAEAAAGEAGAGAGAVRHDIVQTLAAADQLRARGNIGAGTSSVAIGTAAGTAPDAALTNASLAKRVRVDAAQTFTTAEKAQGRGNLNALGSGNGSISGIEFYSSEAALPVTGVAGVLYVTPETA